MTEVLKLCIRGGRSDQARRILQRIAWRGYVPPCSEGDDSVDWELPADQIDLIRAVLFRNRRLAGDTNADWNAIRDLCQTIAEESRRHGIRPDYGTD